MKSFQKLTQQDSRSLLASKLTNISAVGLVLFGLVLVGSANCLANDSWANAYMGPQSNMVSMPSGASHPVMGTEAGSKPTLPPLDVGKSHDHRVAPYAGHYGHTQQSPSFRWGWFGAEHFYPQVRWHEGYNGELVRWSNQRRY